MVLQYIEKKTTQVALGIIATFSLLAKTDKKANINMNIKSQSQMNLNHLMCSDTFAISMV